MADRTYAFEFSRVVEGDSSCLEGETHKRQRLLSHVFVHQSIRRTTNCGTAQKRATNENFESFQQGKSPNRSIELAVRDYYLKSEGERYVWNQETIPSTEQNKFSLHPEDPQPVLDISTISQEQSVVHELKQNGFAVLHNVLPPEIAETLHETIVELARTALFRIPRIGMDEDLRHNVLTNMSVKKFAKNINHDTLKNARYFIRNQTGLYCGTGTPEEREKRMRNLQGVQGLTLSSQMLDVYSHPYFATVLATLHASLKNALKCKVLYFSKERCSLHSYGSAGFGNAYR